MLKLNVMHKLFLIFVLIPFLNPIFSLPHQLDIVRISSPKEGEILQGNIYIEGTISGSTFQFAEISFQYQDSQSSNWFQIGTIDTPIVDDTIVVWDTSTIADGIYRIRVVAHYENDRVQEAIINNLDIRNYTPLDTVPNEEPETVQTDDPINQSLLTPTVTMIAVPTPMPQNEMVVSRTQFFLTLLQGAIFGVLLLVAIVIFVIIRRRKIG
jgi:hypothetical protein